MTSEEWRSWLDEPDVLMTTNVTVVSGDLGALHRGERPVVLMRFEGTDQNGRGHRMIMLAESMVWEMVSQIIAGLADTVRIGSLEDFAFDGEDLRFELDRDRKTFVDEPLWKGEDDG